MKRTVAVATIALLAIAALSAAFNARLYSSAQSAGIAWDAGGVEVSPAPGVFLCVASGHMQGGEWVTDWTNPLAPLFPVLVADC